MNKAHKNGSDVNESTEALRADIDETRERLSSDIDALGNKLSPQNIKAEAKQAIKQTFHHGADQVRETVSTAGGSLLTAVKENPLPVALIGVGIGWLVLNLRNASSRSLARNRPDYAVAGRAGVYDPQEPARMGAEDANSRLHELGERAQAGVESVKRVASDTLHQAHDQLDRAKTAARDGVRKTQEAAVNAMEENPLLLGALTLGVGVAVGLSIPSTESEDKLVGQYRDRFMTKAKEKASGLAEIAKDTARRAAESGAQSAKKQLSEAGLSSESSP
jgi:ElaB/YqjD/DUF883 family membrane-anchored ribosome-binding protein